jgi:hypothetical protein
VCNKKKEVDFMKLKISTCFAILFLTFLINCASPGEQLKKENPSIYNKIIGQTYILSKDKLGEVKYVIYIYDDGSVGGGPWDITNAKWKKDDRNQIYIYNEKGGYPLFLRFNDNTSDCKSYIERYAPIYNNYLSKLEILELKINRGNGRDTSKYIVTKDIEILKELKNNKVNSELAEQENWNKLNKNSVSSHITFIQNVQSEDLKSTAEKSLNDLFDKKIVKFITSKYKAYSKFSVYTIILQDGTQLCTLSEFLRVPILGINHNTGAKWNLIFRKNKTYPDGFEITMGESGKEVTITYKPYKGNLVAMKFEKGGQVNPQGWEIALPIIAGQTSQYPALEYIDVDLLENL